MRYDRDLAEGAAVTPGPHRRANPLGVVGLDIVLTALLFAALLKVGVPLGTSILAAWIGGAVTTVVTLIALAPLDQPQTAQAGSAAILH